MKKLTLALASFLSSALLRAEEPNPQPVQIVAGIVSSNFDLYTPYTGNRQVKQMGFQATWEPFVDLPWGSKNVISVRGLFAPKKDGNEGVEYGYLGLGIGLNHYSSNLRRCFAVSLDFRRESYVSHPLYGLATEVRGTMIRPWLTGSFTYSGTLVPYTIHSQWEPITRLEFGRAFATPSALGAEGDFRKHSEELQGALYLGVRF